MNGADTHADTHANAGPAAGPEAVLRHFWSVMGTNDFAAASRCLTHDFRCHWPQSGEIVAGRDAFARVNAAYPAAGKWRFTVLSVVAGGDRAASDVSITDGQVAARCIGFYRIEGRLIAEATEWWPDPMPVPAWRIGMTQRGGTT